LYIDGIQSKGNIVVWTRDSNHKLKKVEAEAPYYCYHVDNEGTLKTIFGHSVSKMEFANRLDFNNFVDSHNLVFESDISPLHKYLSDNYYKTDGPFHKAYFDIEVDFNLDLGVGYPTLDNPYGEVTSISLYDSYKNEYHLIMLCSDRSIVLEDDDEHIPVNNYHCVTERQLLDTFLHVIEDIDILSAWNGDDFDIPYIIARCQKIYGEDKGIRALCRDGFPANVRPYIDDFGNDKIKFELAGRQHLDMLELYKKFTYEEATSYKLDNIAEKELKKNKRSYPGDLSQLYRNDPKAFFDYSLHDTRLLKQLDDKKKLLNLAVGMSRQATIRFNEVMGSIKYLEFSIRNHCHFDREEVLIIPDRNDDNKKESFPGAFVLDTKPGIYGWSQSIDLASLYPSVMRALNISPETHVLQCLNGHFDFIEVVQQTDKMIGVIEIDTQETTYLKAKDLHQLMKQMNLTISANGSLFDNSYMGIIPEVLTIWYKRRKDMQKKSKQFAKDNDKTQSEYFDMLQHIAKIGLNSLYGAISNPFSRFYTLDCAKSITLTGQEIEKYQMRKVDQLVSA
jgi:DNA polymerase elongation subunit (family B)